MDWVSDISDWPLIELQWLFGMSLNAVNLALKIIRLFPFIGTCDHDSLQIIPLGFSYVSWSVADFTLKARPSNIYQLAFEAEYSRGNC